MAHKPAVHSRPASHLVEASAVLTHAGYAWCSQHRGQAGSYKSAPGNYTSHTTVTAPATCWTSDAGASFCSSGTVWGPGALTGKTFKAFGEATLRGIETLRIRRRLAVISSCFPHDDATELKDIDSMYDDLLELSRRELYDAKIRQRALLIIFDQVTSGHVSHLLQSLAKLPPIETQLFVSDFLRFLLPHYFGGPSLLRMVFKVDLELEPWSNINFICQLVNLNEATCQLLMDMGFLDSILDICIDGPVAALATCDAALSICVALYPQMMETIFRHPLFSLWSSSEPFCLRDRSTELMMVPDRPQAWRRVGEGSIVRRIAVVKRVVSSIKSQTDLSTVLDTLIDLLEFSHSERYPTSVKGEASLLLNKCMDDVLVMHLSSHRSQQQELSTLHLAFTACISSCPEMKKIVPEHPLFALWPSSTRSLSNDPSMAYITAPPDRPKAWRRVGEQLVHRRIGMIPLDFPITNREFPEQFDILVDLLEFSSRERYPLYIVEIAKRLINDCLDDILEAGLLLSDATLDVCNAAIAACASSYPKLRRIISHHPLFSLWPSSKPFSLRSSRTGVDRRLAWRKVRDDLVTLRMNVIESRNWSATMKAGDEAALLELSDVYVDLLEFSSLDRYPYLISSDARLLRQQLDDGYRYQYYRTYREALYVQQPAPIRWLASTAPDPNTTKDLSQT